MTRTIVLVALVFASAACQTRGDAGDTKAAAGARVEPHNAGLMKVTGAGFSGFAMVPSDAADPPEWQIDAAAVDQFEAGLGPALAQPNEKIQAPAGIATVLSGYVRRYNGYRDREGGRRMIVDFYCEEAAANASRGRTEALQLQGLKTPHCFGRAIYDVDKAVLQQFVVR